MLHEALRLAFSVAFSVAASCAQEPTPRDAAPRAPAQPSAPAPAADAATPAATAPLRLVPLDVDDPGIGTRAFSMLIPKGWQKEGGVRWQHQFANLASAEMVVRDPQSAAALELIPIVPCCWDESGTMMMPAGQNYMGSYVARPPRDPADYVRTYFVPLVRADRKGLKIGDVQELPQVAAAVAKNAQEAGVEKRVASARVRLEYEERGKAIAEDVYVTVIWARSALVPQMTQWTLEHQYAFRAEKEKLASYAPLLQAMVASVRIDLAWYAGYAQVVQLWRDGQMQSIRNAGEISRMISRNNDAMLASMRASWEERQRSQDRVDQALGDALRGVERYENPFDAQPVELPSGYDDAWVNVRGEYLLSNTAGFDPNVGDTVEWRRMAETKR